MTHLKSIVLLCNEHRKHTPLTKSPLQIFFMEVSENALSESIFFKGEDRLNPKQFMEYQDFHKLNCMNILLQLAFPRNNSLLFFIQDCMMKDN